MIIDTGQFFKKCDFNLCQNLANKYFVSSKHGKIFICDSCIKQLKKHLRIGETNGREKQN